MRKTRKTPRIAAALAVVVGMLTAFAALGGVGLAQTTGGGPGKGQYGKGKVTICHKGKRTITVSKRALPAHLAHRDTVGRCDQAKQKGKKVKKVKVKVKKGEAAAEQKGSKGGKGKGKGGKG